MSFPDAVRSALTQYATFSGRARRSEYWFFYLAVTIAMIVASVLDQALGLNYVLYGVVALALLLPNLATAARRLHDTNRSGWWLLIGLVPLVGAIVLLVFLVQDSTPGVNQYGPSPKYASQEAVDASAAPAV